MVSSDTICALATPAGGAIGIIRLSGPMALDIADKVFSTKRPAPSRHYLAEALPNTIHYGIVHDLKGNDIDEVVVLVYKSPHSYTGEDAVEICCHGSQYILQQVLHTLISCGARQAEPGEYTKRAWLNGKMDLSQAEAVADLIAATNKATQQMALSQLKGHFSSELSELRKQLLKLTSLLELELDFSDHEELEFANRDELKKLALKIDDRITTLSKSFKTGNALKQGVAVAIIGKTNVGKSTLLNRLLHEEKAIVSDIDGTTRDTIEDVTNINGVTFRLIDTAGIRETYDTIEKIGIERAYKKLGEASVVLWMIDSEPAEQEKKDIIKRCKDKALIVVVNKIDKENHNSNTLTTHDKIVHKIKLNVLLNQLANCNELKSYHAALISAKLGLGMDKLEKTIYEAADIPEINENSVIVTSARHFEALLCAHESIQQVIAGLNMDISGDLLAEDLKLCLSKLADITGGQITSQETLNNIFSHFCIGK